MRRILSILFLCAATVTATAADFTAWSYKSQITFSGYTNAATLTNFPALVYVGTNISGFAWTQVTDSKGFELRFSDSANNELNYEFDSGTNTIWTNNAMGAVWVQLPILSASTNIWAYWGNSAQATTRQNYTTNGAAWANYSIVLHFGNGATVNAYDSSPNRQTYTTNGGISAAAGKVSGAAAFNGSSGWIDLNTNATWLISASKTISFWLLNKGADKLAYVYDRGPNVDVWGQDGVAKLVSSYSGGGLFAVRPSAGVQAFSAAVVASGDYYAFAHSTNTGGTVYCDRNAGQTTTTITSFGDVSNNPSYRSAIGRAGDFASYYFDGTLDEFRIATVTRSAPWIAAEYLNATSNSVFQAYGASQSGSVAASWRAGALNWQRNQVAQPAHWPRGRP